MKAIPRPTRQRWGIRARVTIAAGSVLAVVLSVGAFALVALVHHSLVANLDSAASTRARDLSSLVSSRSIPTTLPTQTDDSGLIQVVDASNSVVSASANVMGEAPVLEMHPQPTRDVFLSITSLPVGNQSEPYRIAVHPVAASNGPLWIYVATSLSQVNAATNDLAWSLAIALPVLLGFLALTISLSVGRSLRPIESIRVQALAMGVDLHQRVPVPRSRDEVSRLAVTVNQMLDRLEHAAQKQKQFVGDASHELRSPLASLRAEVEVELAQSDHAGVLSTLERVQLQAVRMTDLIEDLLFLARLHEGHSRQSFESVDLDEVVIDELRRLKALNKVEVSIGQLDAVRTLGSPRDLARLVRNIGDNALRHAATEVEIELADHGDSATITIANDGPPIPPEDRQRIFDRFTRLDGARSRRIGGGVSGLGLAIAQEIATAHGGHISVLTRQNETAGVTFVVTLPITQDDRIHP